MDNREERLFRALGDVGSDLIDTAEHKKFLVSPWRKFLPVAACAAILVTAALVLLPKLKELEADPSVSDSQTTTEAPAETETVPEQVPEQVPEEAVPKARLTISGTIYYEEGFYEETLAKPNLGNWIATVSRADDPALEGANVYAKRDCTWKNGLPLEVFVENQGGYTYCLTYFFSENPFGGAKDVALWRQILENTAIPSDSLDLTFENPKELTSQELYEFFVMTLAWEEAAGQRSEDLNRYLWYRSDLQAYAIPKQDLTRQLSRYLHNYVLVPGDCRGYDPQVEAVCVKELIPQETEHLTVQEKTSYDPQTGLLDLWLKSSTGRTLNYGIQCTGESCLFSYMREIKQVHPIAEAQEEE